MVFNQSVELSYVFMLHSRQNIDLGLNQSSSLRIEDLSLIDHFYSNVHVVLLVQAFVYLGKTALPEATVEGKLLLDIELDVVSPMNVDFRIVGVVG